VNNMKSKSGPLSERGSFLGNHKELSGGIEITFP